MRKLWGGVLAVTAFIACPCHLPITLPLLLGVLGGTGLGTFIAANTGLVYGLATAYFVVGLGMGFVLWKRRSGSKAEACEMPTSRSARSRSKRAARRHRDAEARV